MRHLDLFSGIGGFALAIDTVWPESEHIFCDNDTFCQKVLKKHWPNSKIYGDIRKLNGNEIGTVDLVTGGFPCQPFSSAGQQRGKEDDRDLWPQMLRIIQETKPHWVIGENVAGFIEMELERTILDLESEGYEVQPLVIPACAVNAPHRRNRVWIIAYSESIGDSRRPRKVSDKNGRSKRNNISEPINTTYLHATHSAGDYVERSIEEQECRLLTARTNSFSGAWKTRQSLLPSAVLCRTDDGIPNRVDRTKALGNAIVPQVAIEIMKAINAVNP